MSDILSQSEIDALLSALSSGDLSGEAALDEQTSGPVRQKNVRNYDFKKQNKFSKEHIRTLSMIHEAFSRILSTALSAQLRMLVQIEIISVEQLTFDEYSRSLPSPTILNVFTMEPLIGTALFEINLDMASAIIDRMLGGPGKVTRIRRDLSDIERTLVGNITNRTLASLAEAWSNIIQLTPKLETMEMNPRFIQIVPPSDAVVLIIFEAKFGENMGPLSLCIPYIVLEPVMGKISAQTMFAMNRQTVTAEHRAGLEHRVSRTAVEVSVLLGRTTIQVDDLLGLQAGDVLPLHAPVGRDLEVQVGNRLKFRGHPGVVRNHMAVQVTDVVDDGEEGDL